MTLSLLPRNGWRGKKGRKRRSREREGGGRWRVKGEERIGRHLKSIRKRTGCRGARTHTVYIL